MKQTITADQLVYTNVTAKYSPAGQRGYQAVCASAGLTKDDCQVIESQIDGLPRSEADGVRWQFFQLADGRTVLTRSQYFHAEGDFSDPRGGTYLAHVLVISRTDFAAIHDNPMGIIDGFLFVHSAREMVERFGAGVALIPAAEASPAFIVPEPGGWAGSDMLILAGLAANAEALARDGQSVRVQGNSSDVLAVLRLTFHLAQPAWRGACTFDTMVQSETARPGKFWTIGTHSQSADLDGYILIDSGMRSVTNLVTTISIKPSIYTRWLAAGLEAKTCDVEVILRQVPIMQLMASALETGETLSEDAELNSEACSSLAAIAGAEINACLFRRIQELLSGEVSKLLAVWLTERLPIEDQVKLALGRSTPWEIISWTFEWLIEARPDLPGPVYERLLPLACKEQHVGMVLIASVSQRKLHRAEHDDALAQIEAVDFQKVLTLCPEHIQPVRLANLKHGAALVEHLAKEEIEDNELADCLVALVAVGYRGPFMPISARVEKLRKSALKRLLELPGDAWRDEPSFEELLNHVRQSNGRGARWWNPMSWRGHSEASPDISDDFNKK